tara:strand:- start:525 stop:704 length:180 start_codon:yes stop_codon:yes gene_type:complete
MGEAKRRKQAGLAPKKTRKESSKSKSSNLLAKYPKLGLYLGAAFLLYLIYDLVNYYTRG